MRSLDVTSSIISLLKHRDRLSLYCSSKVEPLMISTCIRSREIKAVLDEIDHDTIRPKAGYLRRCVEIARNGLSDGGLPNKHLIVLTCNPYALERLSLDSGSTLHLVCPGPTTWTYFKANAVGGWLNLNQMFIYSNEPRSGIPGQLNAQYVRSMLSQFRTGKVADHIENVSITVIPGSSEISHEILGSVFIQSISVGERKSALVKCNLTKACRRSSILDRFPRGLITSSGELDLKRELDSMLDDRPLPAFTVKIKYEHTALPSETTCEYTKEVFGHTYEETVLSSAEEDFEHHTVQQRLAYYLASNQKSPARGLEVLSSQFSKDDRDQIPAYVLALLQELKYQARIKERYDLSRSSVLPVLQRYSLFPETPSSSRSLSNTLSSVDASPKVEMNQAPSHLRVRNRRSKIDQARQMWSTSRAQRKIDGLNLLLRSRQTCQDAADESEPLMKDDAMRRGGIGIHDRPRGLLLQKGKENIAPWL